jgi:hypothetical protein
MFCAFAGPPNIVRLHGRGRAVLPGDDGFDDLRAHFDHDRTKGIRAIIDVDVIRISDSCGFSVPLMTFEAQRDLLDQWTDRKSDEELVAYRDKKNAASIDGLPAYPTGR